MTHSHVIQEHSRDTKIPKWAASCWWLDADSVAPDQAAPHRRLTKDCPDILRKAFCNKRTVLVSVTSDNVLYNVTHCVAHKLRVLGQTAQMTSHDISTAQPYGCLIAPSTYRTRRTSIYSVTVKYNRRCHLNEIYTFYIRSIYLRYTVDTP